MSHSKGVKALEAGVACVEQQKETTATDVMLLGGWHDLAARKRSIVGKQISITHF
jgi:hypothetical protein